MHDNSSKRNAIREAIHIGIEDAELAIKKLGVTKPFDIALQRTFHVKQALEDAGFTIVRKRSA